MTTPLESVVQERQHEQVDREKTCPLLLRVFCTYGRHHPTYDYQKGIFPLTEFQIYTCCKDVFWDFSSREIIRSLHDVGNGDLKTVNYRLDATLREITNLMREVNEEANEKGTTFDFQLVMPDRFSPKYMSRDIGTTVCGMKGNDDEKTLSQCKFVIGDYMDVCITPPARTHVPNNMRRMGRPRYKN